MGPLNNGCRTIFGTQKGTIILTTTHLFTFGFKTFGGFGHRILDCSGLSCDDDDDDDGYAWVLIRTGLVNTIVNIIMSISSRVLTCVLFQKTESSGFRRCRGGLGIRV